MGSTTPKEAKISIKVMLQKDKNKVIFAEADSNFVDILFSFLTLPLGTIARILEGCPDKKDAALGGIKNLCQSIKDLPENYLSADESKYILLNPRSSAYNLCRKLKINIDDTEPFKYFMCHSLECLRYASADYSVCKFARCTQCGMIMDNEVCEGNPDDNTGGDQPNGGVFVSEVARFLVTDDLHVMPNTSDLFLQLLSDHGITDSSHLVERTFDVGREQILIMLKGALLSKPSLTYLVFPRRQFKRDLVDTLVQPLIKNEVRTKTQRMTLKVSLQKSTSKFLFAEAEEDFVDFLFGFLGIPLGVVIGNLMNGTTSFNSLDNLFASIATIGEAKYFKSNAVIDILREPQLWHKYHISRNQIFPLNGSNDSLSWFDYYWESGSCNVYVYHHLPPNWACNKQTLGCVFLKDPRVEGSFIKSPAKFMLTDDLCVTPLSPFSTIALLNKLNVPLNDVESHELSVGMEEGLKLLRASLMSTAKCLSSLTNDIIVEKIWSELLNRRI